MQLAASSSGGRKEASGVSRHLHTRSKTPRRSGHRGDQTGTTSVGGTPSSEPSPELDAPRGAPRSRRRVSGSRVKMAQAIDRASGDPAGARVQGRLQTSTRSIFSLPTRVLGRKAHRRAGAGSTSRRFLSVDGKDASSPGEKGARRSALKVTTMRGGLSRSQGRASSRRKASWSRGRCP